MSSGTERGIEIIPPEINLAEWVNGAKADPIKYRTRQITEILLYAIGLGPSLKQDLVLKGGTLMSLAFDSSRSTGDVDFTSLSDPEPFTSGLRKELDGLLRRASADLGHFDLICQVQKITKRPRESNFETANAPALQLTIASAIRGTSEERRLFNGNASQVLDMEISFHEPVITARELRLAGAQVAVQAYTVTDLIAEKFRALLQQVTRQRNRRQDVYDIAWIVGRIPLDASDRAAILKALHIKAGARNIKPTPTSLEHPEVIERARADWNSMTLEIAGKLPTFEESFKVVDAFYRALPWASE
ncbi:MAG TPA: nucleotidyl transferase AbiEii/AbiGii toxin family protein [Rhizomicrobium sp.]|jgi:predicted nucleotidyltransferase component of viral defense system|nr:nucleotidyl transferase AbiEii/AbiGii toxin family protein [Rhizomicrobium sp.]